MATYVHATEHTPGGWEIDNDDITQCAACEAEFKFVEDSNGGEYHVPHMVDGKGYCGEGCEIADAMDIGHLLDRFLFLNRYHGNPLLATRYAAEVEAYKKHWPKVQEMLQEEN